MTHSQFQQKCLMYAQWWMHSASNGHSLRRKVQKIVNGRWVDLTPEELIDDAMKTAKHHIEAYSESCDQQQREGKL